MTELKRNEVLIFDDGLLTVKISGHGSADGWGELAFHERQSEFDADGFHHFEIPPSELAALRDFLNRVLPAGSTLAALKAAERAIDDCQNYRSHLHHKELAQVRAAISAIERSQEAQCASEN